MNGQPSTPALTPVQRELLLALLPAQGLSAPYTEAGLLAEVRRGLERRLPGHLMPRAYAALPALPLTRNGKINLDALPTPLPGTDGEAAEPRNETERRLVTLFCEVLGRADIGIHDDFFLMGGDSLLATELGVQINARFGTELPITLLFSVSTVAGLAASFSALPSSSSLLAAGQEHDDLLPDLSILGLDLGPQGDDPAQGSSSAGAAPYHSGPTSLEQPTSVLRADVTLDDDIWPATPPEVPRPQDWRQLFLTGGTGYFGSHLLAELLTRTGAVVHCLVRAATPEAALERLRAAFSQYLPGRTLDEDRVRAHPGDLTLPRFGLGEATFTRLGHELDAIFHAGATVNFAFPYRSLRPSNVQSSQELFRLAASGRSKAVHFISTINIFSSPRLVGRASLPESEDILALPSVIGGYAQSRWVAEGIVGLARARGFQVSLYRPSIIGGDSVSGISNENDALCRMFKGCVQLRLAPHLNSALNIVSADYAAAGTVQLALDPGALGGTFHLVNTRPSPLGELFSQLRDYGYALRATDYGDWQARIEAAGPDNALYPLLPIIAHLSISEATGLNYPHFGGAQAAAHLTPLGLSCPPLDTALIRHYLDGMVRSGFLPAPTGSAW